MNATELLLIDVSSIAHALYHVSGNEPDPSFIANQIVVKVRQLASRHPHAAVCLDSGKSFRHDLAPDYKANRDTENRAVLKVQIDNACATLAADGFPIWAAKGYEADDVIATATHKALAIDGDTTVLIASADKDLCQLVSDRVRIKSTHPQSDGAMRGPAEVLDKFKVRPDQMLDYLCLVGDASDNVKGADGIGPVKAAGLLKAHGDLASAYVAMSQGVVKDITPAMRTALMAFKDRLPLVRDLIALKSDAPIPFAEIAAEREAKPMAEMTGFVEEDAPTPEQAETARAITERTKTNDPSVLPADDGSKDISREEALMRKSELQAMTPKPPVMVPEIIPTAPRDFSQELEPRSMDEAIRLAQRMYDSRLFGAYGTPQAVLSTILAGRELGMGAMKALRSFHIIEGKPAMSADLIAGQVLASGKAKYFRPLDRSDTKATFSTLRIGDGEEPFTMAYTIEDAKRAWKRDQRAWDNSGWGKNPADMLVARCKSKLARLVYPDVVSGLYAPEEFE